MMKTYPGEFLIETISIGHWHNTEARTGCTAIIAPRISPAALTCRGAAPATRELDLLHIDGITGGIDGVMLTGGSAFGLDAGGGMLRYLEEKRRGYDTGVAAVPLVPTLSLFDLAVGDPGLRPGVEEGYAACEASVPGPDLQTGSVGAGCGATVNKLYGMEASIRSGIGTCSAIVAGCAVACIGVSNAFGAVGEKTAADSSAIAKGTGFADLARGAGNCTFAVICIDAGLGRKELQRIADMAFSGFSRAIEPAHTPFDFDAVIVLATGMDEAPSLLELGHAGAVCVREALIHGVTCSGT